MPVNIRLSGRLKYPDRTLLALYVYGSKEPDKEPEVCCSDWKLSAARGMTCTLFMCGKLSFINAAWFISRHIILKLCMVALRAS